MASRAANKRLTREYQIIQKNPPPFIIAHPSETNILEWHYVLTGPPETPYEGLCDIVSTHAGIGTDTCLQAVNTGEH